MVKRNPNLKRKINEKKKEVENKKRATYVLNYKELSLLELETYVSSYGKDLPNFLIGYHFHLPYAIAFEQSKLIRIDEDWFCCFHSAYSEDLKKKASKLELYFLAGDSYVPTILAQVKASHVRLTDLLDTAVIKADMVIKAYQTITSDYRVREVSRLTLTDFIDTVIYKTFDWENPISVGVLKNLPDVTSLPITEDSLENMLAIYKSDNPFTDVIQILGDAFYLNYNGNYRESLSSQVTAVESYLKSVVLYLYNRNNSYFRRKFPDLLEDFSTTSFTNLYFNIFPKLYYLGSKESIESLMYNKWFSFVYKKRCSAVHASDYKIKEIDNLFMLKATTALLLLITEILNREQAHYKLAPSMVSMQHKLKELNLEEYFIAQI